MPGQLAVHGSQHLHLPHRLLGTAHPTCRPSCRAWHLTQPTQHTHATLFESHLSPLPPSRLLLAARRVRHLYRNHRGQRRKPRGPACRRRLRRQRGQRRGEDAEARGARHRHCPLCGHSRLYVVRPLVGRGSVTPRCLFKPAQQSANRTPTMSFIPTPSLSPPPFWHRHCSLLSACPQAQV